MRLKIAVLCMVGVASAIAQTPSTDDSSKAVLYVYRLQGGSGPPPNSPSIYCDEQELARMQHGRYFSIRLDAGKHSCRSTDGQSVVELDVKAGQTYYIRGEVVPVGGKPRGAITRISPEQGASEARKLKPLPSGMVKDPNRVLLDPPQ
jgi:hypothetical protein